MVGKNFTWSLIAKGVEQRAKNLTSSLLDKQALNLYLGCARETS